MFPARLDRRLKARLAVVAADRQRGCQIQSVLLPPVEGNGVGGQGTMHAGFEAGNALDSLLPGLSGVGGVAEIGVGHGRDLAFDLVEHQHAVRQHPTAIWWIPGGRGVDRHSGLDPADQLITPHAKQLAHGGQPRYRGWLDVCQLFAQQGEGIALQQLLAPIAPVAFAPVSAPGESPEGVADHKTPAAKPLAAFDRLEQDSLATALSHLQPGGEGRFQIGGPAFPDRYVGGSLLGKDP